MPFKQFLRAFAALLFAAWLPWHAAVAQQLQPVPTLTARLLDQTQTLSAEQAAAVESRLRGIEEKSGSQVVVLMVPTTAPEDIAAYAWRVADSWKIGRKTVGDGLLIVVAKNDRRMRMEVARALEGAIPDLAAARIIDEQMAPRFRQNDYAGGILAALDQVAARIAGEALPVPTPATTRSSKASAGLDLEELAIFLFFGVMVAGPIVRGIFGNKLGAAIMGGGTGALAYVLTTSLMLAGGAGVLALLVTLLSNGRRGGGGGGPFIGGGGGGWGGGGGFGGGGGGGFSSGGGGSFGGGGASGSW